MKFTVKNGVRQGEQKLLGSLIRWTERPWEWTQDQWFENERVYQNGFFKSLKGRFELISLSPELTQVTLKFSPSYRWSFLAPLMNFAVKRIQAQLLDVIEESVSLQQNPPALPEARDFAQWLTSAQEVERAKIAPKEVAAQTFSQWETVFREAIQDRRLALRFEAVCPHCRGGKQNSARLTDLPSKVYCDSCEIEFAIDTPDSVEVSFRDSTIPASEMGVDFCSADVKHRPSITFQRAGGQWEETLRLKPGIYSLKRKGEGQSFPLVVNPTGDNITVNLDELWTKGSFEKAQIGPELTLRAHQLPDDALVMLENLSQRRGALHVIEVLNVPEFVELVPAQSLITAFPLEMGERTVMFTDLVGSTDMYYLLGDKLAFQKVRDNFLLIGEIARAHQGYLVKTIGDATMYAFSSGEQALKAALAIQQKNQGQATKIRITLHHGPCLSIGTSDGQDFFGDTINICAKFQAIAHADQIVFDQSLRAELSTELWNEVAQRSLESVHFELKGAQVRAFELYRMTV